MATSADILEFLKEQEAKRKQEQEEQEAKRKQEQEEQEAKRKQEQEELLQQFELKRKQEQEEQEAKRKQEQEELLQQFELKRKQEQEEQEVKRKQEREEQEARLVQQLQQHVDLLQRISHSQQCFQNEITEEVQEVRGKVQEVKGEVQEVKGEVQEVRGGVQGVNRRVQDVENELSKIDERVAREVDKKFNEEVDKIKKLLPLRPPLFSPEFLLVNDTGTLLAVAGPCGVLILQLPARCPPYGAFENNKEVVYCKSHSLDERLLSCSDTVEVRQAKFHPGSVNHDHILVLTNDNMLRLYQIENNEARNISVYSVGEKPTGMFPGSKTAFLDIYGEMAVDFDFGLPEVLKSPQTSGMKNEKSLLKSYHNKNEDTYMINVQTQTVDKIVPIYYTEKEQDAKEWNNLVWPLYILRGNMSVYSLNIDLKKRWKPILKGPLPMSSFQNEQSEACSLICLNTIPEVMCIATSDGILCHSILLDIGEDTYEELKDNSRTMADIPTKEILAFESVELEMGLSTTGDDSSLKYKCQICLKKDESKPGRYYATHSAGIHSVSISCIDELQQFVQGPEDSDLTSDIFVRPTKAEYVLCTKTATSQKINPVIGFALYYEPTAIIALLGNGSLVTLGVLYAADLPKIGDLAIDDEMRKASPLKKMLQEPFDVYIQKILKKTSTQPVLKLPSSGEHTHEQCYELLQRAAQAFREDYFKNHSKAREELEKRVQTLSLMKKNQQKEIKIMKNEQEILQERASNLAEKYEDIKDKQDELLKKCENLLMLVARKKRAPSDSEKAFMEELQAVNMKVVAYGNKIDKSKNKMKYQEVQIETWKAQEVKKVATINETHTNTIKTNLQESATKITNMVQQVKEYKSLLNLK